MPTVHELLLAGSIGTSLATGRTEKRKEKAVAVKEIKAKDSYTVIVSDGEKQSTLVITSDGIQMSVLHGQ